MEDRYQLMEPLGTGGMATVHKAKDQLLGRHVAVKRLLPHLAADPDAAERFRREAQSAAGLNHPGIVTVYDTAEDEKGPYIVMELIEGETLASKVAREGPLGAAETAAIVRGAADALDHAHANGVVHRDIKPSNLIVDDDGRVRLTDFGIARAMEDPTMVTSTGEVVGTLAYMAPETLAGEPATPASDIYSLGAVSYQMLSGRPPFEADNIGALVTRIRDEPPPPLGPEVPSEIAAGVLRSLDKDPAMRPDTAAAYATSLLTATTVPFETPPPTQPLPSAAASGSSDPTEVYVADRPAEGRRRRGLAVPVLLFTALALVLGLLALLAMAPGPEVAPAATQAATTTSTTTTTLPTTTTTLATTTTLSPDSPELIAAGIYELLDEMGPPEFKPNEVKEIRERLDKIVEKAAEGEREEVGRELEKVFEVIGKLPESEERQRLFDEFVRLAESYGFEVSQGGDDGGGDDDD